jgi:hypothetical protein
MSQKYKKPAINEKTLVNNPFVGTLVVKATKNTDKSRYLNEDKTGYFNPNYFREQEYPVKVYTSSGRREVLNLLGPNSTKLLIWCIQELEIKQDWFWLNKQRYMDETGVSYNTYKNSVKELQDQSLLLKTSYTDVFWINPHYFFRGNRIDFYKDKDGVVKVTRDNSVKDDS